MKALAFLLSILFSMSASAKLAIPRSLDAGDRLKLLETLGPSSAMKVLSDPYPLGGYLGVEFGLSSEIISTEEVARLGIRSAQTGEISYSILTFGKGLYDNFDIFVQFAPLGQAEEISNYGAQIRWGFFQAEYLPMHLSLILGANSVNYQELLTVNSQAVDLVSGFVVDDLSFYLGVGNINSQGTFIGGPSGITADFQTQQASISAMHYLVGINMKFSKAFLALQLDRTTQATYSFKLGVRY